jgi:single-stranded DNA-binding protein
MSQVNAVSIEGNIVREITFNEKGNAILTIVQNQYKKKEGTEEWEQTKSDFYSINIFKEALIADVKDKLKTGQTVIAQARLSTFKHKDSKYPQMTLVLKSLEIVERKAKETEEETPVPVEAAPEKKKRGRPAKKKTEEAQA